ncbi:MAG: S41 family peptidase [Candidatus Melainabacteria bacterium]|nr:S41 family peptidase [Candidatus Melainabacteria bacterium]
MAGNQEVTDKQQANADPPAESSSQLYASADLSTNPVPRTDVASNPTMDALEFKAPDFRAPTDVAAAPAVPPEKSQEATDVANLFSAVAKGDKDQVIALQTKLLGSNNVYEGSYMGQNFRLSREKYNEKTHKVYAEAQYLYVGNNLVSRTNVRRDEAKREVQSSGNIVSVARNQYAPGSDTSVAAGNVTDGKFLNADDQRNNKGAFVQSLLPKGTDVVKQLVQKAQTANAADVRLGKGTNAFEAKVNLTSDGTVGSVVGKTPLEPARPPTDAKVEVTQPQPQPGQIETFLRENKDNKARELVGAISSGDISKQAQAIRQLVDGGVRTLGFTRPGAGEKPQELSFVPNNNGSISVKLDGQVMGRVAQDGRMQPDMLSQNLKNLGLDSNGTINVGVKGKEQKFELAKSPVAAPTDVISNPADTTQRIESPAIQSQKLQELAAKFNAQGYSQLPSTQLYRPGDMIASVRPDGTAAVATITGLDNEGRLLVEDGVSKQILSAMDWTTNVNPEKRNLTLVMRKNLVENSAMPPVETTTRSTDAPYMNGAILAQQANSIRDADQFKALERLVSPYGINIGTFEGADALSAKLTYGLKFARTPNSEPAKPGDIHILAPKATVSPDNIADWDSKKSPGMVLAITNEKGETVRLSDGQKVDESQFLKYSFRSGLRREPAPALEASVVMGRLFKPGQPGAIESATDPVSTADFESKIKAANSGFTPQGQIPASEIQNRIQSMDVGTSIILNTASGTDRSFGIVGEVPAGPNSSERKKVLFVSTNDGGWLRVDDTNNLKGLTTADVYKPNEKVNLASSAESSPQFEQMLNAVTKEAFNIASLQGDPKAKERFYAAIKSGALPIDALKRYISQSGDLQTDYLTRVQLSSFNGQIQNPAGIGSEITLQNGQISINQTFADSPSTKAIRTDNNQTISLQAGDIISAVNKSPTAGKTLDEVTTLLKGAINSTVEVEIKRPLKDNPGQFETFSVSMTRKPLSSVLASMDSEGVVHIRMNNGFTETSGEDFKREIERMKSENGNNIKGYILDLRQNGGGLLDQSLRILSAVAPDNSILLNVRERNPKGTPQYLDFEYRLTENSIIKVAKGTTGPAIGNSIPRLPKGLIDKPISTLVDGSSASASEIVASAFKDWNIPVYGNKTYGKGTVQTFYKERGFRVTTAQYLSPLSHQWFGNAADIRRGVQPDVVINSTGVNQLTEAKRLFLQSLAQRKVISGS